MSKNATIVERQDSHMQLRGKELDPYKEHMKQLCGDTTLPPVLYKGQFIPARQLSEESFYTRG